MRSIQNAISMLRMAQFGKWLFRDRALRFRWLPCSRDLHAVQFPRHLRLVWTLRRGVVREMPQTTLVPIASADAMGPGERSRGGLPRTIPQPAGERAPRSGARFPSPEPRRIAFRPKLSN